MAQFFVFALPRSRTYWLSHFLLRYPFVVHHDLAVKMPSLHRIREVMSVPLTGLVDTGAAHGWMLLRKWFPAADFAVIRRPRAEVERSLWRQGANPRWVDLDGLERRLDEISAQPGTLTISYADLDGWEACRQLFGRCLHESLDHAWYASFRHLNLQIDIRARLLLAERNQPEIAAIKKAVHDLHPA